MNTDKIINENFTKIVINKNDYLLEPGQTEDYLYYIEKGIIRMYYYNTERDSEHTFDFIFPKHFSCSYKSFKERVPSEFYVQALTNIVAYRIHYQKLDNLIKTNANYQKLELQIIESLFLKKLNREICLLKDSPESIYQNLIKDESHILKHVPLKHIASYIGITPQALSRIRNRIS